MTPWIIAAALTPFAGVASAAAAKVLGRWLVRGMRAELEGLFDQRFADLDVTLNRLRAENAADHASVGARLLALEQRVHDLERAIVGPMA